MDSSQQVSDVFSLSDHLLAQRLQFVKEIGFGNWGSVWLCRPKSSSGKVKDMEVAVKLVHRSKTSTTAARVRSLWNEMKIVRSFKNDPHPSIVPFHSFIITPSYALITMAHLPTLVPVEVSEPRAKEWFRSLLSGVHHLHARGVVHNDIKPANILLSRANIPVLVDFGFAEKYDQGSPKAFHSNLTYGTPEYLAPERARGLPHDTRKSDIWSLGVTFFEILVGRTPFEYEEGEVFEKKEDLEKYWHRTMRGKWVGKYSMSQAAEDFLKRMIVPNADLRCTAAEAMGDAYWDLMPAAPAPTHRKSASAAVPSTAHSRAPSVFDSLKHAFKEKDGQSRSRRIDISLPWSPSRSTLRSSVSRSASRTESPSRSVAKIAIESRPVSRAESTTKVASNTSLALQSSARESASMTPVMLSHHTVTPVAKSGTHSRSKSQPRLRTPLEIPTVTRARKLSTVQASPVIKPEHQIGGETEPEKENDIGVCRGRANAHAPQRGKLVSLNSNTPLRRPLGPRQPSPRVTSMSGVRKESLVPLGVGATADKSTLSHLAHLHTPVRTHTNQVTGRNIIHAPVRSPQTLHQGSAAKQPSGKPPRTRGRTGVLADLTGLARNVDLSAHGVGRPTKRAGENKDRRKENSRSRPIAHKQNKENDGLPSQVHSLYKDKHASGGLPETAHISQSPAKGQASVLITPPAANTSSTTAVAKGSVRDRMMDWEKERQRLREMDRLADAEADGDRSTILSGTTTSSDTSDDDDSAVEAEVVAEAASAQAMRPITVEVKTQKAEIVDTESQRPATTQTVTTISSSLDMEKSQIEIAKLGVRASAQILLSQNGSVSAPRLGQGTGKWLSEENRVRNESVTDIGLPIEVQRNGESGLTSLKHSVKASIDKGMRLYKSSLVQLTGRSMPVWCISPEPINFEQRRSGEEGRFSWENIRPEREIALDRMNMWIQSVEKVVEETRQNFATTSVTPPAALPLASISRSPSQYQGVVNIPTSGTQNNTNNTFNTIRSSRLPRRLLAANEIFAQPTDPNASLLPASSLEGDTNTSFSFVHAPESSVPVLPSISVLMQTPRRRRATVSTGTPAQRQKGSPMSDMFDGSPAKRREKSKSQSNLDRHIKDVAKLEQELSGAPVSSQSQRLSAVFDRSLFVAPPISPRFAEDSTTTSGTMRDRSIKLDDLNSSPYHVEPYPVRRSNEKIILTSPDKRHLEGVYDRFLMATSGVKRLGKGYQSDNLTLVDNTMSTPEPVKVDNPRGFGVFGSSKRTMPPPVSSEDAWRRTTFVDEFGFIAAGRGTNTSSSRTFKDDNKRTFVRRAIKAMVPGRTSSRRLPQTVVA